MPLPPPLPLGCVKLEIGEGDNERRGLPELVSSVEERGPQLITEVGSVAVGDGVFRGDHGESGNGECH